MDIQVRHLRKHCPMVMSHYFLPQRYEDNKMYLTEQQTGKPQK